MLLSQYLLLLLLLLLLTVVSRQPVLYTRNAISLAAPSSWLAAATTGATKTIAVLKLVCVCVLVCVLACGLFSVQTLQAAPNVAQNL